MRHLCSPCDIQLATHGTLRTEAEYLRTSENSPSQGSGSRKAQSDFHAPAVGKGPACQCRRRKRHWYDPWAGKTPWRRAWQFTPVFLPGES